MRFTPDELRQAIRALNVIEELGDRDEWAYILRQAHDSAVNDQLWGNATSNQQVGGQLIADRLAGLLGEDKRQCEQAAAEVFAPQRHRAVYDAMLAYAAELTGKTQQRGSSPTKPVQRPAVRIVADKGDAA